MRERRINRSYDACFGHKLQRLTKNVAVQRPTFAKMQFVSLRLFWLRFVSEVFKTLSFTGANFQ